MGLLQGGGPLGDAALGHQADCAVDADAGIGALTGFDVPVSEAEAGERSMERMSGLFLPVPLPSPSATASSRAAVTCQAEVSSSAAARWLRTQVAVGPMIGSHQRRR